MSISTHVVSVTGDHSGGADQRLAEDRAAWEEGGFPSYLQSEVDDFCASWSDALQVNAGHANRVICLAHVHHVLPCRILHGLQLLFQHLGTFPSVLDPDLNVLWWRRSTTQPAILFRRSQMTTRSGRPSGELTALQRLDTVG